MYAADYATRLSAILTAAGLGQGVAAETATEKQDFRKWFSWFACSFCYLPVDLHGLWEMFSDG